MSITEDAAQAAIGAAARDLHLPTVRTESTRLAEIALRERQTHLAYLAEVDRRKLYLELAFSSLFAFCTDHLGLTRHGPGASLRRFDRLHR